MSAPLEEMDELPELKDLLMSAPPNAFPRFRRRSAMVQGGKLLLNSQVNAFWIVLDTLLKRIFRNIPLAPASTRQDRTEEKA